MDQLVTTIKTELTDLLLER